MIKRLKKTYNNVGKYCTDLSKAVGITILIMPPVCALVAYIMTHFYGINFAETTDLEHIINILKAPAWYLILLKFIGVGCAEESLFRQLIQNSLFTKVLRFPRILRLVVASMLFGAVHIFNPGPMILNLPQAVGACFAGAWFGYLYEKRGLTFAILTHGLYDFVVVMATIYL